MNNKMQPALIGGLILGILSAIPVVSGANLCCCAWAVAGGIIAAYLYIKRTPFSGYGDLAIVGAIAGLIGAIIYLVVGIPLSLLFTNASLGMISTIMERANPEQAAVFRQQMEMAQNQPLAGRLVTSLLVGLAFSVLLILFATIGSLIGAAIFGKRTGSLSNMPPPPPPSFNNPPSGPAGYGA